VVSVARREKPASDFDNYSEERIVEEGDLSYHRKNLF
jgi:hypothetical protein